MATLPTLPLAALLVQMTKEQIYQTALDIAERVGLAVSSWQAGDPTRSSYFLEAEILEVLEKIATGFIGSDFLDIAKGDWLKVTAKQKFNVDVPGAVFATTDVVLTNASKKNYDELEPGDVTVKNSLTGKTYKNTTGGNLAAKVGIVNGTLTVSVIADEAGSDSTAGPGEIDEIVTTLLGVTVTNPTAAIGIDEQDESVTVQQCRDKLGSLSPNGAKGAYAYVARNSDLTGTRAVTRVRVFGDTEIGEVTIYLAGPSGGVAEPDRALVEAAIVTWCTPLCVTPTVLAATDVPVVVTYELWIYRSVNKTEAEVKAGVLVSLEALFQSPTKSPIGGDIIPPAATGKLYASAIESAILATFDQGFRCSLTVPGDTALANDEVAVLGTVTAIIHLIVDP